MTINKEAWLVKKIFKIAVILYLCLNCKHCKGLFSSLDAGSKTGFVFNPYL
jgi:hypothetical protein